MQMVVSVFNQDRLRKLEHKLVYQGVLHVVSVQ